MNSENFAYKFIKTKIPYSRSPQEAHEMNMMNSYRNEPCTMINTLEATSELLKIDKFELADQVWKNSLKLFGIEDDLKLDF